jgi:divalent metal cation (Fe/Co/Zn/Cd) transporter
MSDTAVTINTTPNETGESAVELTDVKIDDHNVNEIENAMNYSWQVKVHEFPIVEVPKKASRRVRKFYKNQNNTVEELKTLHEKIKVQRERLRAKAQNQAQVDETNADNENPEERLIFEKEERLTPAQATFEKLCLTLSFWINVLLAIVKLGSSIVSLSLAVITSTFDSFLGM